MAEKAPLREQLKRLLEAERLDDRQYARLHALTTPARRRRPHVFRLAVAVAMVVAVAVTMLFLRPGQDAWQLDQIARHVSHYHLQTPPLEVRSESLPIVSAALDRLDFRPVLPQVASRWRLLGGRHCTLLGGVASQLLFEAEDGQRVTLYETAYDPGRFAGLRTLPERTTPIMLAHRGLHIRIWIESGLVMAEVREAVAT